MLAPIVVTASGIVIEVKLHPLKAPPPISETESGILMVESEEQPAKAFDPIEVTPFPIVADVSEEQL